MPSPFRTGFGSKQDVSAVHQPIIRKLKQHIEYNCLGDGAKVTARREEMIAILTSAVDKLLEEDGNGSRADRPAFGEEV